MSTRKEREVDTRERWIAQSRCFGPTAAAQGFTINPLIVRQVLDEVSHRGGDATTLLDGLGFDRHTLSDPAIRLTYDAASEAVRRAILLLDDPDLGLVIGMRHHIISWGFVGLGAMACSDLSEALAFGIRHQAEAGSLLALQQHIGEGEFGVVARPRFADVSIERVLVDGIFVAILNAGRFIWGDSLKPVRIELVATQVASHELYQQVFQCPVHFSCKANRMVFDQQQGGRTVDTADKTSKSLAQSVIDQLRPTLGDDYALRSVIEDHLRCHTKNRPTQAELAAMLGMNERTLRRQLRQEGCSYKDVVDQLLRTCALEQIVLARRPAEIVARELGFASVGRLAQAFWQWTGLPLDKATAVQ
jgi:AraC-like DNA-binding protein